MSTNFFPSLACLIAKKGDLRVVTSITLLIFLAVGCKEPAPRGIARGKELFNSCAACHGPEGKGNKEIKAPQIAGLHENYVFQQLKNFRNGHRGIHPDDLEGQRMHPMARYVKSVKDLESLAFYVASLTPERPQASHDFGGDPVKGKAHFTTCTACHGDDGAGNLQMNAPSLRNSNDWYLLSQLKKFDKKIRGYTTEDTGGTVMTGSVLVLQSNEQMMRDVVAYIMTLK